MAERDPQIAFLLAEAPHLLGKPLSPTDCSILVSLYSWAGISADVLLMIVGYCCSIGKKNMRYIEKTATGWADDGIDTHEKAEQRIQSLTEIHSREGQVKTAFGIHDRQLVPKEKAYIQSWFGDLGYQLPMIRLAYERTIENTGKLSFQYVNSILNSWHSKGFRTPEDAAQEQSPKRQESRNAPARPPAYDLEELERKITYDHL